MTDTEKIEVEAVVAVSIPWEEYQKVIVLPGILTPLESAFARKWTIDEVDAAQTRVIEKFYGPRMAELAKDIMAETIGYLLYGEDDAE